MACAVVVTPAFEKDFRKHAPIAYPCYPCYPWSIPD